MLRDESLAVAPDVDTQERDYACTSRGPGTELVGQSEAIRSVLQVVERVAPRDLPVLITGETGTGKELVARLLHETSRRRSGPFVRVNCGAIPATLAESELFGHQRGAFTGAHRSHRGYFGLADGGTLLLDEVEALPREIQPKVLRALEGGEIQTVGRGRPRVVDVRVVACSNVDLEAGSNEGWFRADLYYRLAVVTVELPPLRARTEDIAPLAEHFARAAAQRFGVGPVTLTAGLLAALRAMPWPGNARQLQHVITSMVALSDSGVLDETMLPSRTAPAAPLPVTEVDEPAPGSLPERMAVIERRLIADALRACGENRSEAARRLGVRRTTLLDRMRRLGLRGDGRASAERAGEP